MVITEGIFVVVYECSNCKHRFQKEFPKGTSTFGNAGNCPNCSALDEAAHPFNVVSTVQRELLLE